MTAQSLILPLPSNHGRFIVINLKNLSLDGLKEKLSYFISTRDRLITQHPDAQIKTAIAFGPHLWPQLYPHSPQGLKQLQAIDGRVHMPARPADLFIQIASSRADICFALSQCFFEDIKDQVEVLNERVGFRYLDGRDLTGFIDGTENPQMREDRAETALLGEDAGEFADSSFVFVQRYVHDLDKWKRLRVDAQEDVIGRSKLDSIEMSDEQKPKNAHIARVVIEDEQGEELEILRHSLPYGDGQGEQGLFFVAYTKDLTVIDRMLQHMFGSTPDGIHDRLLHFVTPVDGAYFFVPNEDLMDQILGD